MADPECLHEIEESAVPASSLSEERRDEASGEIKAPELKRKVEPDYPLPMSRSGIGGVVVLEAVISRNGCIVEIETQRSVNPMLDYAAARGVSQWRY
jgi:TonB family protein